MEKCFEKGTIQAFLDGELAADLQEKVACHISVCDKCTLLLAEAEEETAIVFSALGDQFDTLVPTQRLWAKINDSIEQNKSKSIWQAVSENFRLLFANPSIAAFAGLLVFVGILAVVLDSRTANKTGNYIARQNVQQKQEINLPKQTIEPTGSFNQPIVPSKIVSKPENQFSVKDANSYKVVKADFAKTVYEKKEIRRQHKPVARNAISDFSISAESVTAEYLPDEETYIKTIATLEKTVDSRKDEVLKPSARFSFEKDLAVANDAIDKMKTEVRQNPKNEAAKQVLRASYQNKIDLLNSVTEKNDLMASLR